MNQKVYILQKELPDSKPGDRYIWNGQSYSNNTRITITLVKEWVENNPEWFKPEGIEVTAISHYWGLHKKDDYLRYSFETTKEIDKDLFPAIKEAIEKVLNEESFIFSKSTNIYTQEQLNKAIEDAFHAARESTGNKLGTIDYFDGDSGDVYSDKYPTVVSYMESLKNSQ